MNHKKIESNRSLSDSSYIRSLPDSVHRKSCNHTISNSGSPVPPWFHRLLLLTLLFISVSRWIVSPLSAEVPVPPLTGRVIDQTGTLDEAMVQSLESKLEELEKKKGSQVAVLIVPTTGEETIEQYSIRVTDQWKLGRKGVDDGALLLVAKDDRKVRIEVGYGLEGALTDLLTHRIISDIIIPQFKKGDYSSGIAAGVDAIIAVIQGEPLPEPKATSSGDGDEFSTLPIIFVVLLIGGFILQLFFGKAIGALVASGLGFLAGLIFLNFIVGVFLAIVLLFVILSAGSGGGGIGGGSLGGGSFGGGFSGGGGGFGGGGSSGSW